LSRDKADPGNAGISNTKENEVARLLGMRIEEAFKIWEDRGRPAIKLGPGEECCDLEKLLLYPDILKRHLEAVKAWLEGQHSIPHDDHSGGINPTTGK